MGGSQGLCVCEQFKVGLRAADTCGGGNGFSTVVAVAAGEGNRR